LVVRSKRGVLVLQAILAFALVSLVGWAVEAWGFLPMSRLTDLVGLPGAFVFFAFVGLVIAVVIVKDNWGHRIAFESEHLRIEDSLGAVCIRYDEIAEVRAIPFYGAGIKLKQEARWLATFKGTPAARQKKQSLSAATLRSYRCEIAFPSKCLDVGVDRFVEELRQRLRVAGGGDAN
jgi:hypothetical protein